MATPRRLRVIGPREIYRLLLPPEGKHFESLEFSPVTPGEGNSEFSKPTDDQLLTIVVDPESYEASDLAQIAGPVWYWFLEPIATITSERLSEAPRLALVAEESIETRREFLVTLPLNDLSVIVASDRWTFDYCSSVSPRVLLSPPPVNDELAHTPITSNATIRVWPPAKQSPYLQKFLEPLPRDAVMAGIESLAEGQVWTVPSHWVVPQSGLHHAFPYEAAMALVAGQTLITESLVQSWGLEPGLDYIEYSTPDELHRIVEHLMRYPESTRLMAGRGKTKSSMFIASNVYARLLSSLGVPTHHRAG